MRIGRSSLRRSAFQPPSNPIQDRASLLIGSASTLFIAEPDNREPHSPAAALLGYSAP